MIYRLKVVLFFIVFSSCKVNQIHFCKQELQYFETIDKEEIALDFSQNSKTLIHMVEAQTKKNLCHYPSFNASFKIKKQFIQCPIIVLKDCEEILLLHNIISVSVNQKNEVSIDDTIIKREENIEKAIFQATSDKIRGTERKEIIYLLDWNKDIEYDFLEARILQLLQGISMYANDISKKEYHRTICDLEKQEIEVIKNKFRGIIGFSDIPAIKIPPPLE